MFQAWDPTCIDENGIATLRCIPSLFHNLVVATLTFVGVTAIFFIIFSGIQLVTSGGDPKKVQGARSTLTWAIVGLVIVLSSFAIIYFIAFITKTDCITDPAKAFKGGC